MDSANSKGAPDRPTSETERDLASIESLMTIELFHNFPESVLQQLSANGRIVQLQDQEILCKEGSEEKKMWGLLAGQLLVFKLRKTVDVLEAGSALGEMSLIDEEPRSVSVRSIGKSTLIEIGQDVFHKVIMTNPQASFSLLRTLTQRIRHNMNIIGTERQHLHSLIHDLQNYLAPLSVTENKMEKIIRGMLGTQDGHKNGTAWMTWTSVCEKCFPPKTTC